MSGLNNSDGKDSLNLITIPAACPQNRYINSRLGLNKPLNVFSRLDLNQHLKGPSRSLSVSNASEGRYLGAIRKVVTSSGNHNSSAASKYHNVGQERNLGTINNNGALSSSHNSSTAHCRRSENHNVSKERYLGARKRNETSSRNSSTVLQRSLGNQSNTTGNVPRLYRRPGSRYGDSKISAESKDSSKDMKTHKGSNRIPRKMEWLIEFAEKSPSDVVSKLANRHSGFEDIIRDTQLLKEMPIVLILIIKMLAKVGDADFIENKISVLVKSCKREFLEQIQIFISFFSISKSNDKFDVNEFLHNLLLYSKSVAVLLPSTAVDLGFETVIFSVNVCITVMGERIVIREDVKQLYEDVKLLLANTVQTQDKKTRLSSRAELLSHETPPNDFRDINLIPTVDDIFADEVAFVRPNLVQGAYANTDHYLDVQFRLLHEDFLCPMREGIREYIHRIRANNMKKNRITNVRLYNKVIFLGPKVVSDRIGIAVNFDPNRRLRKVNWKISKHFMYGSLLCFTQDKFKSIMFGTVIERDEKDLRNGVVVVGLCVGSQIRDDLFKAEFTMAESEVYFEPYYQVLKALKEMREGDFPMKQYIVDAESEGRPPQYLMTGPAEYTVDEGLTYPVLVPKAWPSAEQLGLDDSQYRAFKFALTKEFVVIQGPPGTGKTFIGLKVAGVLLKNSRIWNRDSKPILVVCYTNHALDQFLEGLLGYTKKVVRAGSRSKSELMEKFNLQNIRRNFTKQMYRKGNDDEIDSEEEDKYYEIRMAFNSRQNLSRDIRDRMQISMAEIKGIQLDLEMIQNGSGIISLKDLHQQNVVPQNYYSWFSGNEEQKENEFVEWLLSQNERLQYKQDEERENSDDEVMDENYTEDIKERFTRDKLEDYDLEIEKIEGRLSYAISTKSLTEQQGHIRKKMMNLRKDVENNMHLYSEMPYLEFELEDVMYKAMRLQERLKQTNIKHTSDLQQASCRNLNMLCFDDRWTLYRSWLSTLKKNLLEEFKKLEKIFRADAKLYEEARSMIDLEIMKSSHVIGMTTTYAARYQTLLKALKPKIVIVEEAAEVLESHIIVSLTNHCEHLILIGDHQQLRPSTSVYKLAKEFRLDVSLFERMLNNGMHCEILNVQHRMRPEIAALITPSIYRVLHNHADVTVFDQVQGVTKNLFFIDHSSPEEVIGDNCSRRNVHEAEFLVALCRHLILQGYEPNNITMLTTYTAQMFYMKTISKKYDLLQNVRITVVDNFQGEENDIILLSLVRSNDEDNIGFLKIENRVCVALSRARKGLYIMGNMKNLLTSEIWPKIKSALDHFKSVGPGLELQCKVHPDQKRLVVKAEDFEEIPEGGCNMMCESALTCGHLCQSVCHASDREHTNYRCPVKPCDREMCDLGHKCKKLCFEECGHCLEMVTRNLPCGHQIKLQCYIDYEKVFCQVLVQKELPDCKHMSEMACSQNPAKFPCAEPCNIRLDNCGHTCRLKCHVNKDPDHLMYECKQDCPRTNAECSQHHPCKKRCYEECGICEETVVKKLPKCGHSAKMACGLDLDTYNCQKKCNKIMECGHTCHKKCFEECTNCNVAVTKDIPGCDHRIKLQCSTPAVREMCKKPCERTLDCGHKCTASCGAPCTAKCQQMVTSDLKADCGHIVQIPCYKKQLALPPSSEELLSYCKAKCETTLECGHECPGTCSDCYQGRIHVSCQQKCGRTLICGHGCKTPCPVTCPPCMEKCIMRCYHNKCNKKCGQPCTPCYEKCMWKCKHLLCTKQCSAPCDRPPCSEPCENKLKCGHLCIGFCGEPCPKLCLICDQEEVTTIMFGHEDEEDARFVLLEDCNHIVEHRDLDQWLTTQNEAISMAVCPKCKTPISRNRRYSNIIKQRYEAVCEIKRRTFGEKKYIDSGRNKHFQRLRAFKNSIKNYSMTNQRSQRFLAHLQPRQENMNSSIKSIVLESKIFLQLLDMFIDMLNIRDKKDRKNILCGMDMETMGIKTEILCQMGDKVKNHNFSSEAKITTLNHMNFILSIIAKRQKILSTQEVSDINLEVQRFHRIVNMCVLESMPNFKYMKEEEKTVYEAELCKPVMSIAKYSMKLDASLKETEKKWSKKLNSMAVITEEERQQIVKAVGMKPGHWHKCPNGHYYVITECGGASQVGQCNECKAWIGGTGHRLLPDNHHAPEMDNSRFPAWSEAANMANYALHRF